MRRIDHTPADTPPPGEGRVGGLKNRVKKYIGEVVGRLLVVATATAGLLAGCVPPDAPMPDIATASAAGEPAQQTKGDIDPSTIDLEQVIKNAQEIAYTPDLADLHMQSHPLDPWIYAGKNERKNGVVKDGSRYFDLGYLALSPGSNFTSADTVNAFLNSKTDKNTYPGGHVHWILPPESIPENNSDGTPTFVDVSLDINKKVQDEVNKRLTERVIPNNDMGNALVSMTGVDVNKNGKIDSVVPTVIDSYTINLNSRQKEVYVSLKQGETLWDRLGFVNMTMPDGTSYSDEALNLIFNNNPAVKQYGVDKIPANTVIKVPTISGVTNGN